MANRTIGVYRFVVELAAPGPPVPDGDGGFTEGWAPLNPPIWDCSIDTASAAAMGRLTAGAVITTVTHRICGRYHAGISTDTRITFEGRTFEVQQVINPQERNERLELLCVEQVDLDSGGAPLTARRAGAQSGPTAAPMPKPAAVTVGGGLSTGGLD